MSLSRTDALALGSLDAHDQAALVRAGDLSARELVEAALVRIDRFDPELNAVTWRDDDHARALADRVSAGGPLSAVPYLLKDGMDYPGMPSFCGSRARARSAPVSVGSAYTERLDAAGLLPVGKSNAPEFGLLPTTEPILHGAALNPWNPLFSPGGSSGGAAVAVASGMVPVAHAADGAGSIRIPASCCGIFGLKPGRGGNVRARGAHVIEDLIAVDGLLGRSVRDVAEAFRITHPAGDRLSFGASRPRRLRIGIAMENLAGEAPHAEVADAVRRTADLCADLGHEVVPLRLPVDGRGVVECFRTIWACLAMDIVSQVRAAHGDALQALLEPWTLELAEWGKTLDARDVAAMYLQVARAGDALSALHRDVDVVLSPVLRTPPVRLGALAPVQPLEVLMRDMFDYVSYTPLHNLAGTPAMSVPLFSTAAGLPVGSMFAAAEGGEALLFELAFELERAAPWAGRWPAGMPGDG